MAQVDTGLGWEAKDSYLLYNASAVICEINGLTGGADVPYAVTEQDAIASGFWTWQTGSDIEYLVKTDENPVICLRWYDTSQQKERFSVYTTVRGTNIVKYHINRSMGQTYVSYYTITYQIKPGIYALTPSEPPLVYPDLSYNPNIPNYPDGTTADNAVNLVTDVITKANLGYAVSCFVKYKTKGGEIRKTPVLISTEQNSTVFGSLGTYSIQTSTHRYDGVTFYMSLITDLIGGTPSYSVPYIDLVGSSGPVVPLTTDQLFQSIALESHANIVVLETIDPFEDFPPVEEDIGNVDPDPDDDDIDFDELPDKSFASAGFCRIFNPDESDLNDLASYMWTDQTFLQTVINHLKQILENPIEAIISLCIVPVVPETGPSKVPVNVMFINTGVSMRPVTKQFIDVDCGTVTLEEMYGGALDYNPYTRVQLYLPYIGTMQLDTDEVMNKTLHLMYHIDVVTGICSAELKAGSKVLYHFSGQCAVSQPITSADFSSYLNAAIAASKAAVGIATGMSATTAAAVAAGTPAPSTGQPKSDNNTALVPVSQNHALVPSQGAPPRFYEGNGITIPDFGAMWGEMSKPGNLNNVGAAMGGKMVVQHSGGFSGNSGYLAHRRPYIIIERPNLANPEEYGQHNGRPSMKYLNLGTCTGYTQVQSVHLTGLDATNPELSELSSLLKGGVIF